MNAFCVADGQTAVFIGDSITDVGRREEHAPYGIGYVSLVMDLQRALFPDRKVTYINRGINGDKVLDLRGRWAEDVIAHKPDLLSVKIGINDVHEFIRGETIHAPAEFRKNYDAVLTQAKEETDAKLLLIDPFYMMRPEDADEFQTKVLNVLPEYIDIVHEMAEKFETRLVRTHDMFVNQLKHVPAAHFCEEPVHPNRAGHICIAVEVMKAMAS